MGPGDLSEALAPLARSTDPRLLVGHDTFDDAGVFRLTPELALVQTVDFFAPIVDDPYTFGQIAAANALSDVFAMGAQPLTALCIVGFPTGKLPLEVLTRPDYYCAGITAIASISTSAPRGSAGTCTVERAGRAPPSHFP